MDSEQSEIIAIKAIEWIASDRRTMARFLGTTGLAMEDVTERIDDPEFLAATLDFLLMSDCSVKAFCQDNDLDPITPMAARQALPGGDNPHWT